MPEEMNNFELWGTATGPWDYHEGEQWIIDRWGNLLDCLQTAIEHLQNGGDVRDIQRNVGAAAQITRYLVCEVHW